MHSSVAAICCQSAGVRFFFPPRGQHLATGYVDASCNTHVCVFFLFQTTARLPNKLSLRPSRLGRPVYFHVVNPLSASGSKGENGSRLRRSRVAVILTRHRCVRHTKTTRRRIDVFHLPSLVLCRWGSRCQFANGAR